MPCDADDVRMRRVTPILALMVALSGCGGGEPANPTTPLDPPSGYVDTYDRANDVADQLDTRESELDQMVEDMGG